MSKNIYNRITVEENNKKYKQDYRNLISGTISSVISRTIVAPLDRLKILYQVDYIGKNNNTPSIIKGLKLIYQRDGITGYFKGNGINVLKGSPENGIKLYYFEYIKWNLQYRYGEHLSTSQLFFAGAVSGVIATCVIFPLEVLKIRIAGSKPGTYSSIFDATQKIYKEPKGIFNFYSGIEAGICTVIPNAGLNLTIYEYLKIFFSGKKTVDNAKHIKGTTLFFIGGLSALLSSTILYPLQIIQARMIMYNLKRNEFIIDYDNNISNNDINSKKNFRYSKNTKFIKSIIATYKYDGLKGFYKGYAPGITKIVIGNAIGFYIYEKTKNMLGVNSRKVL